MKRENAARRTYQVELHFEADPQRVFPLLCPVREYDWIEGWSCTVVYSDSGVAELGCIFQTRYPDLGEETWTVSRYEPPRAIEFVRVAPNVMVTRMALELAPAGDGRTRVSVTHSMTALSRAGALALEARTGPLHEAEVRTLETMANHYLRTGERLARPSAARPIAE